ncbi:MAG TPA: DPP IV N-terminal domain-containing protein [Anaerolineaceae bacterium]
MAGCTPTAPTAAPAPTLPQAAGPAAGGAAPAWIGLGLKGSLLLIVPGPNGTSLQRMDLGSGSLRPVYQAPDRALISTALLSPDGNQILLAYAPPPTEQTQLVYTSLYLLAADGKSAPKAVFSSPPVDEAYFAPVWAADGKSIYTSHFKRGGDNTPDRFSIDRVTLDGQLKPVLADAEWPSLSPDGQRMAYVSAAPGGPNDLYLAGIDGSNPHLALPAGAFPAVDDHFFTPDGKGIVFSAVNPQPAPNPTPSLFERIFGIDVVAAHNVPSDWYVIAQDTGKIQRLTTLEDTGMYATLSPDRRRVAFIAASGIYVMNLDGTQITQLTDQIATGTVDWQQ